MATCAGLIVRDHGEFGPEREAQVLRAVARCATKRASDGAAILIQSWGNEAAKEAFAGRPSKGCPANVVDVAFRKLAILNAAERVEQLRTPAGNRLHKLDGDLKGKWSLSVNMQYRIVFTWGPQGPEDVWFGDYH